MADLFQERESILERVAGVRAKCQFHFKDDGPYLLLKMFN